MAQVPYNPVPSVAPSGQALPSPRVDTPLAAFGGESAAALSHLGQVGEQASNELFSRAIALKQLDNDTAARQADTDYMITAGKLHADYGTLQGEDAVRAYPKYAKDLQEARQKIRGTLTNPAAQRLFDAQSLSTMGRSIFSGAGHAATENRQWSKTTATSQMELDAKTVEDNPTDDKLFQQKLQRIQSGAAHIADMDGYHEGPQKDLAVLKATSKAWAQRIVGLSRTAPFEAAKMLDANSKQMTEDDRLKVDNIVRSSSRAVGSANIANDVWANGMETPTRPGKPLADMEAEAEAEAKKQDPKDPLLAQHAVATLRTKYNQSKYAERQELYTNKQIVADAIGSGQFKTIQELRADPKVAASIDALPATDRNAIPGQINRYLSSASKQDNEETYTRLRGQANNDVEGFLNTDLTSQNLSQGQIRTLQDMQSRLKSRASGDPRVLKSISMIRGSYAAQLEALGIFRRTETNKEDYDHYTGALQAALDDYLETNKKPADDKTILNEIAPKVLQQRAEPAWFGLTTKQVPFFTQDVPENFGAAARKSAVQNNEAEPTDAQIYQSWLRYQWKTLNKPKAKAE